MARVSVIIATYNRADLLDGCLASLREQPFARDDEVLVVDNGSTDATAGVIARHAHAFPVPLRRLVERRPGKSHALARALQVASGDLWVFTDDDVVAAPEWLGAIRHAFNHGGTALVGGPVSPRWECPAPRWLRTSAETNPRFLAPLGLVNYGPAVCALGERTLLGANLAIRRDVMHQVGGFATQLGKLRGTLLSGEDDDLCRRVQAAGFTAVYVPDALVHHWVPRQRMRVRYYLAWFFWSGITLAVLDGGEPRAGRRLLGLPAYLVRRLATSLASLPSAALRGEPGDAIERALDVAFAAGYAARQWGLAAVTIAAPQQVASRARLETSDMPHEPTTVPERP